MIPLRDNVPGEKFPFSMWLIIALNFLVFFYELSLPSEELQKLFYTYGLVPANHSLSSFITCTFLHGSWMHIIGNMWALFLFGNNVEDKMGPVRFILFYLACGVIAGATHCYIYPQSTVPTVGASGALAGVMGAYFLMFPKARVLTLIPVFFFFYLVEIPAVVYLGFWAFTQLASGTIALFAPEGAAQIAFWAHVGGFGAGMILHRLFLEPVEN
ncbi:rhomboid family intramembrane serine protease [Syntrophothermus lipocalidus]|uniref:Rhomboid family protein n=1 Tax=Syntrophothermus lipocalidus (strain DSM 12680 / TGB-C1) TaxID=643648 RepID=D7CJX5_SYNLT|nr:rhomboid family intramembrane serine protease [Syntrophothermus lipocalidus]ADI01089.1 Rhomboid family protein [Syntrophothermus lipocalidus DSM 12680]